MPSSVPNSQTDSTGRSLRKGGWAQTGKLLRPQCPLLPRGRPPGVAAAPLRPALGFGRSHFPEALASSWSGASDSHTSGLWRKGLFAESCCFRRVAGYRLQTPRDYGLSPRQSAHEPSETSVENLLILSPRKHRRRAGVGRVKESRPPEQAELPAQAFVRIRGRTYRWRNCVPAPHRWHTSSLAGCRLGSNPSACSLSSFFAR